MPIKTSYWVLFAAIVVMTIGCSNENAQAPQPIAETQTAAQLEAKQADVTRKFDWYMEKVTPAGRTTRL